MEIKNSLVHSEHEWKILQFYCEYKKKVLILECEMHRFTY